MWPLGQMAAPTLRGQATNLPYGCRAGVLRPQQTPGRGRAPGPVFAATSTQAGADYPKTVAGIPELARGEARPVAPHPHAGAGIGMPFYGFRTGAKQS